MKIMKTTIVVAACCTILGCNPNATARDRLDAEREKTARALIKSIEEACMTYSMKHGGKLPNQLSELTKGDGDTPPLLEGGIEDPWGNEIKYEKKGKRPSITSFGPDGKEGTEDDITNIRNR